ncbi:MAG: DUF2179 domain-containing protein [Spirochaetes bacterium]|nr:DUF2179 domain-containing protein [Spirochaetota bacterium]
MDWAILDTQVFKWIILPLLIFMARIIDVSLGTMRIIFVNKGKKLLVPLLAFAEIIIWLLAIGQIMRNLNNIVCYLAYAGGFAMGNFIGLLIEEKLAMGNLIIRVITRKNAGQLIRSFKKALFGVTILDARGVRGKVNVVYSVIRRADLEHVIRIIKKFNPQAFYSVEDVRFVSRGVFPVKRPLLKRILGDGKRKGK